MILSSDEHGQALAEILQSGGCISIWVTGGSMMPALYHKRDTVSVRACEPRDLHRGRILLYRRENGQLVLHRLRHILPDGGLIVNGDAQSFCERITPECVLGVVDSVTRAGKTHAWNAIQFRIRDVFWYPTRPIRPFLFRCAAVLRKHIQ